MKTMNDTYCQHWVQRKKRYCRMTVKPGESYCGEHKPTIETNTELEDGEDVNKINSEIRIVCPLDKTHTCYKSKLKKHLKKCNARQTISLPYIQKNINCVVTDDSSKKRCLSNYSREAILSVIRKVNEIYEKSVHGNISSKASSHNILKSELENPEYGETTLKHLIQTSSLLGILNSYDLIQPDTCFIEFGAGKGKLSYWLAKSIENLLNSSVLLIERASLRHKYDNKLEKNENKVQRVRADIADLVLPNVEIVGKRKQIVGITKHLCGDATDFALKCLMNAKQGKVVLGALISFCCHHRCQWHNYTGKNWFESIGLNKEDFDIMCGLVSWAVCGNGLSRKRRENRQEVNYRQAELGLSLSEREAVGKKCKLIIDWGRKVYLEEYCFKTDMLYYVTPDITPENVCVVAIKD